MFCGLSVVWGSPVLWASPVLWGSPVFCGEAVLLATPVFWGEPVFWELFEVLLLLPSLLFRRVVLLVVLLRRLRRSDVDDKKTLPLTVLTYEKLNNPAGCIHLLTILFHLRYFIWFASEERIQHAKICLGKYQTSSC